MEITLAEQNTVIQKDVNVYYDELRLNLAWRLSISIAVIFTFLSIFHLKTSTFSFLIELSAVLAAIISMLLLHYSKNFKFSFLTFGSVGIIACGISLLMNQNSSHYAEFLWLQASISIIYFASGKKLGVVYLGLTLVIVILFITYSLNFHIGEIQPLNKLQKLVLIIELSLGFSFNIYLFNIFFKVQKFAYSKLTEVNAQLIKQNTQINQQNHEKTILVKEIYHRVKNNLQIIISLLRIQSSNLDDENTKVAFQEAINKIMSMALIHQKLYQNEKLSNIEFEEYASELIKTILESANLDKEINLNVISEINTISLEALVPIGLIINELTSNSIKHAFGNKVVRPEINLTASYANLSKKNKIKLVYSDNGQWKEFDNQSSNHFGLSLMEDLAEQLDGSMTIEKDEEATRFIFILKNEKEKKKFS
ncbi:MAG TPA: sensor histidine kinase [Brumimicrobium sp.]|nr:sensor histidine kinase [Brumimicrobium sp.]